MPAGELLVPARAVAVVGNPQPVGRIGSRGVAGARRGAGDLQLLAWATPVAVVGDPQPVGSIGNGCWPVAAAVPVICWFPPGRRGG